MSTQLRERIAETRRARRRTERELNRVGMVLVRLEAHREVIARGTGTEPIGSGDTVDAAVDAFGRLVQPDTNETAGDRREAIAYLTEPLLDRPDGESTVNFFNRAAAYRSTAGISDSVWRVVVDLKEFIAGRRQPDGMIKQFRRIIEGGGATDLGHLHAVVGFAASAARRYRDDLADRLNSDFDGTDVIDTGLLEDYLDAVGDDPLSTLEEQPVLMLPVRLETRFVDVKRDGDEISVDRARSSDDPSELRVRVYPDQVHIDAHEEELTDEEVRAGRTFWAQLWYACHYVTPPDEDSEEPREIPYDPNKLPRDIRDGEIVVAIDEQWDTFSTSWPERYLEIKERAWRQVVERFGRERAAYVVHTLRPTKDADRMLAAGEKDEHPWGQQNDSIASLEFPDVPRRPDAWTAQPRARLLPDRWIASATWKADGEDDEGESVVRHVTVESHPVREPLAMGPDPETVGTMADEATEEGDTAEDDGIPGIPTGMEWLVDFEEARRAGMAMTITEDDLGFDPASGVFETLLVFGVKTSMDGQETSDALQELLHSHHYSDGLEFLPTGTVTNNADVPSAYTAADDPVGSMDTELGPPLVENEDLSDGDVLARMLDIDPEEDEPHVFAHVGNADRTTDREARHMNNALWPATLGYYLQHLLVDNRWGPDRSIWFRDAEVEPAPPPDNRAAEMQEGLAWLAAYRRHFVKYVRGGGPFSPLRIGEQPYGVLPVTPLSTQLPLADNALLTWYDSSILSAVFATEEDDTSGRIVSVPTVVRDEQERRYDFNIELDPTSGTDGTVDLATGPDREDEAAPGDASDEPIIQGGSPTPAGAFGRWTAWTDGAGSFVPRRLDRRDSSVPPHLRRWLDKFVPFWREAVRRKPTEDPDDGTGDDSEPVRPVPRIGDGVPLVDILEMEATAGDYLRKSVFADGATLGNIAGAVDSDITREDVQRLLQAADPDGPLTEEDVEDLLGGDDSYTVGEVIYYLGNVEGRQIGAIRDELREKDMTALDPRLAHLLYEDVLSGDLSWRTIQTLVDDDIGVNVQVLNSLSYHELRVMGFDESITAKQQLIDEQRERFPGTEPLAQKSLLRVLLRFATMQEFVSGRIELGALYDDPITIGPDPTNSSTTDSTWMGQLIHWIPRELAEHPALRLGGGPDDFSDAGRYLEALEYLRQPLAVKSPVPSFGDFTHSVAQLGAYPVDRLETLLTQTLDVASHRLDAWWTSAATRRLFELRTGQGSWEDRHIHGIDPVSPSYLPVIEHQFGSLAESSVSTPVEGIDSPVAGEAIFRESSSDARTDFPFDGSSMAATRPGRMTGGSITGTTIVAGDALPGSFLGEEPLIDPSMIEIEVPLDEPIDRVADQVDPVHSDPAVYVGAYAFVENLEPDPAEGDTEFIHAPSIQHATTAALLRSGHQAHQGNPLGDTLTIDLSADRVRFARGILEGVRNGQSLGALLGYRFERALHETTESPPHEATESLAQYIPAFRQLAPGLMGRLKHGGAPEDSDDEDTVGDTAAKSDVVDGYRLHQLYQADEIAFGKAGLPSESDAVEDVFFDALADPIDALNDLLTAESVHQMGRGNMERTSGSVDALVQGRIPHEPEVVKTPRSGDGITHRQLILFDVDESAALDVPSVWDPETPLLSIESENGDIITSRVGTQQVRPAAEPVLNAWVAALFPDPSTVSCIASFQWTDETNTEHTHKTTATLGDLELSPLDALYLTQDTGQAGSSQLEGRFDYHLRRNRMADVPVDAELELRFSEPAGDGDLSVAEFLELARAVRTLVLDGRAADGEDLSHPADGLGSGLSPPDAGGFDPPDELVDRVTAVTDMLDEVRSGIEDRAALLDRPEGEQNILTLVDETIEAILAFADSITPTSAISTPDGNAPSPAARFGAFRERVADADDVLRDDVETLPRNLLDELGRLQNNLPVGPTAPEDVDADIVVQATDDESVVDTVEPYEGSEFATGVITTPTDGGRHVVSVDFEPDLIVLTASNAVDDLVGGAEHGEIGTLGWSHGVVRNGTEGVIEQQAVWQASGVEVAGGHTTADAAVDLRHPDEELGVRGAVTAVSGDGFTVDFETLGGSLGQYAVEYQAFKLPSGSAVEVGHFRTASKPGSQSVALGLDANYVRLTASSLVEELDKSVVRRPSGGGYASSGHSIGVVVGRDASDQWVVSSATDHSGAASESGDEAFGEARTDRAVHLLYPVDGSLAGSTSARVTSLGENIELEYTDVFGKKAQMPGASTRKLVTYIAIETGSTLTPTVGLRHVSPGETVSMESDLPYDGPALVRLVGNSASTEVGGSTASTGRTIGWSYGTATPAGGQVLHHAVIPAHAAGQVSYGAAGEALASLSVDDTGAITATITGTTTLTESGFELSMTGVAGSDPELVVAYEAWPAHSQPEPDRAVDTIDLEAWSLSPVSGFHDRVIDVDVDDTGRFSATMDFAGVDPGTPFRVVGRSDGTVVYGASGRVTGSAPAPDTVASSLSAELSTIAALLVLARDRERLDPSDGPAEDLEEALDALDSSPYSSVEAEVTLIETLADAEQTTLDPSEREAIRAIDALVGPDDKRVDLSLLVDSHLAVAIEPLTRLGLADLVTVTIADGESSFWRRSDRVAGSVRERLALIDRDPEFLRRSRPVDLLDIDPVVARYIEDSLSSEAEAFAAGLRALVDAPDWFPAYLDGYIDGAGEFLYHLALLLYNPMQFADVADPHEFVSSVDELATKAPQMSRLLDVLPPMPPRRRGLIGRPTHPGGPGSIGIPIPALPGRPSFPGGPGSADTTVIDAFVRQLGGFRTGRSGSGGLEGFLSTLDPSAYGDGEEFATEYTEGINNSMPKLRDQTDRLGNVLESGDPAIAFRKGIYETVRGWLLPASYYGVYGTVPLSVDGGDPADEEALVGQLRAAGDRLDDRSETPETTLGDLSAPDLVDILEGFFGEPFVVLPPFLAPNPGELERTFGSDLLDGDSLAPETWLQRVAHVRERPAAFRDALSYAEAATGTLIRELSVGQLPETGADVWVGLEGSEPLAGQVSLVVQSGNAVRFTSEDGVPSSFAGGLAGLFVDEWIEPVPSATQTTGIALNFDDPGARAPQSILVAAPPESGDWTEEHLRTAVSETFGLAKLRLVDLEALAAVEPGDAINHMLPALWFPREVADRPSDPSVNFDELERFDPGGDPSFVPAFHLALMRAAGDLDLSGSDDGGEDG